MSKYLRGFLIFVLVVGFIIVSPKTVSASGDIKVLLDGRELSFDVPPQIIEGRTLLPLRAIFEALGLEVGWDDVTKIITGTTEGKEIILKLDSKEAKVNGINKTLDVPARVINGRTLVPVRFIAESLDMNVIWDQGTRTALINKNKEIVTFEDPNFEKAVRNNIKKPEGNIYKSDVESVSFLSMGSYPTNTPSTKVNSLEGIQYFINLEELFINVNNTISDLTPIENLINLKEIIVYESNISDLTPLKNLINLQDIRISNSTIADIKPLEGLVNLKELHLINNNIANIFPLRNLVNLETIMLSDNNIDNIDILKDLKNLKTVVIHNTRVSDLFALTELPELEFIGAYNIPITIADLARTYQPSIKKGIRILSNFNEDELLNIQIPKKTRSVSVNDLLKNELHLDELFKRLPINEYVKIFNNNGIYFRDDGIFRLNKTEYYEDGSISYNNSYGKNQLIARFDLGKQSEIEFDNLKEELKIKYGRPFTEDVEENDNRNAKTTRWGGIELRRYLDNMAGETTQLWIFVQEGSGNNELADNKELSIPEIKAYLTSNYGILDTNIGATKFSFNICENESSNSPYDYWIQVKYDYNYFEGAINSNRYTNEQKNRLKQELKEHQRKLAEALIRLLPDKKLYGGYYDSFYTYPNLKVDLNIVRYYSWINYDDVGYSINSYEVTKPSHFRWYTLIDRDL